MGRPRPSRMRPRSPSPDVHRQRTTEGFHGVTETHAGQVAQGHTGQSRSVHGHDLGVEDPAAAPDPHRFAHGRGHTLDLDTEPDQPGHPARASGGHGRLRATSAGGGA